MIDTNKTQSLFGAESRSELTGGEMPETCNKKEPASESSAITRKKKSLISHIGAVRRALAAKKAAKHIEQGG